MNAPCLLADDLDPHRPLSGANLVEVRKVDPAELAEHHCSVDHGAAQGLWADDLVAVARTLGIEAAVI